MKIAIGTDHRGVELKNEIITSLKEEFDIIDCSLENYDTDDYSDYAFKVGEEVVYKNVDFGILICGTGIGMSIAANKVKGVRCALVHNENEAKFAKEHNNANILAFSSSLNSNDIINMIKVYNDTKFSDEEKHQRRVEKIIKYEQGAYNEL